MLALIFENRSQVQNVFIVMIFYQPEFHSIQMVYMYILFILQDEKDSSCSLEIFISHELRTFKLNYQLNDPLVAVQSLFCLSLV